VNQDRRDEASDFAVKVAEKQAENERERYVLEHAEGIEGRKIPDKVP